MCCSAGLVPRTSFFPTANPPSTKVENGKQQPLPQPQAQPVAGDAEGACKPCRGAGRRRPRVQIRTPSLRGSINLKGAQIDDLCCCQQRQTIAKNSPPVRLLSPLGAPGAYIAPFGWTGRRRASPGLNTVWTADSQVLTPGQPVTLTRKRPTAAAIQIKIAVDDGYLFTVKQSVTNASGKPLSRCVRSASSAAPTSRTTRTAGPTTSGRSASSTARPITTSTGKTSTRAAARRSTTSAAGSASPTNIG